MKQNVAASLAVFLAVMAWPTLFWGAVSLLGDYARDTPPEVIRGNTLRSHGAIAVGALSLFAATWLTGYVWSAARKRAIVASLLAGLPLLVAIASLFR